MNRINTQIQFKSKSSTAFKESLTHQYACTWVLWCAHSLFYSSSSLMFSIIAWSSACCVWNLLCLCVYACAFLGYSLHFRWIVFIIFFLKLHLFECLCVCVLGALFLAVTSSCFGFCLNSRINCTTCAHTSRSDTLPVVQFLCAADILFNRCWQPALNSPFSFSKLQCFSLFRYFVQAI